MRNTIIALISLAVVFSNAFLARSADTNTEIAPSISASNRLDPNLSSLTYHSDSQDTYEGRRTNGVYCAVWILYYRQAPGENLPTCRVLAYNETTNRWHFFRIPLEGSCEVELLDSSGNTVKKTPEGQKYHLWSDKEIDDWIFENRYSGFTFFSLGDAGHQYSPVSISELFQVKGHGEYILHVRCRLVTNKQQPSGEIIRKFKMDLPEVVAKVEIRK